MNDRVLYFSLSQGRKNSFYNYVKNEGICYQPKFSFELMGEDEQFNDPRDLLSLIECEKNKDSLHVIIDYVSCFGKGKEINYSTVFRHIIMCYPEVQFLFDETFVNKQKKKESVTNYCFLNFLFWNAGGKELSAAEIEKGKPDALNIVLAEYHQFDLADFSEYAIKKQFILMLKGRNNQFDASNLRYAIKKYKFYELSVKDNYPKLDESRRNHAAVVVDEEYHQAQFNSYCLYANGYRVFPIVSASELLWINNDTSSQLSIRLGEKILLIRDYDLQFIDEGVVNSGTNTEKNSGYNEVDYIRGAKKRSGEYVLIEHNGYGEKNPYWKLINEETYFVSKGDNDIHIKLDYSKPMNVRNKSELELRGMKKPLEGIYAWAHRIPSVPERYDSSRDWNSSKFETGRLGEDGHSCSLDIYGIVRPMVRRAEIYYSSEHRYRLAALVAGDALGILNGFHKSLMREAYYIQSISENAMALSLLGGKEYQLQEDINIRLGEKVQKDVARMVNSPDRKNLLYNIYNDCMLFCQGKEYFNAADEALNVMVQIKDGTDICKWYQKVKNLLRRKRILFIRQYKKVKTWWSNPISCNHKKNQT